MNELDELLNCLLSGRLNDEEFRRLDSLLDESHEARQRYFAMLDLDSGLRRLPEGQRGRESLARFQDDLLKAEYPEVRAKGRFAWFGYAATACMALIALTVLVLSPWQSSLAVSGEMLGTLQAVPEGSGFWLGQRVSAGKMEIDEGRLLIQMDNGALLNLEGPASLMLISADAAGLKAGRVSVRCPVSALGFTVNAPGLSLIDLGTEFGLVAEEGRSEVHVFEGEVVWRGGARGSGLLEAGAGVALRPADGQVETLVARDEAFDRSFIAESPLGGEGSLLAGEIFAYPSGRLGLSDGGEGWARGWCRHGTDLPIGLEVRGGESLSFDGVAPSNSGLLELQGFKGAWRELERGFDLSKEGRLYVSFLLRKVRVDLPEDTSLAVVALTSREAPGTILGAGVDEDDRLVMMHSGRSQSSSRMVRVGEVLRYVIRIDAHAEARDELRFVVLESEEELVEPAVWPGGELLREGSEVLDQLLIRSGRGAIFELDDLRVGESWVSVVES